MTTIKITSKDDKLFDIILKYAHDKSIEFNHGYPDPTYRFSDFGIIYSIEYDKSKLMGVFTLNEDLMVYILLCTSYE